MSVERRFTLVPVEPRTSGERRKIGGYAAIFNRYSENLGGFTERLAPSFFNKSRADGWPAVICRYNHDDNMLLGTSSGRTLNLLIDETGLMYEVEPPQARQDIVELVTRGDISKSSFAFRATEQEWGTNDQGFPTRTLVSGQLIDVAPVVTPAYTDTTVGLRSLAAQVGAEFEEVRAAHEAGDLRKFFVRTDKQGTAVTPPPRKRLFGPVAAAALENKRDSWGA